MYFHLVIENEVLALTTSSRSQLSHQEFAERQTNRRASYSVVRFTGADVTHVF